MPNGLFYVGDTADGCPEIVDESCDLSITSPPYFEKNGYSDKLMRRLGVVYARTLKPGARAYVIISQIKEKLDRPFDAQRAILEGAKGQLAPGQTIIWIKSIAVGDWVEKCPSCDHKYRTETVSRGHFQPINSNHLLNYCWEYVLCFVKRPENEALPLDRKAKGVGVAYADKCLSIYTEMLVRIGNEVRVSTLLNAKEAFDRGEQVEVPSWDFESGESVWTRVVRMSDPEVTKVCDFKLRNGASASVTLNHRFPVYKKNDRAGKEVLDNMSVSDIGERQERWKSTRLQVFYAPSLRTLIDEGNHTLYGYDTGYTVGLFLAEGYYAGTSAQRFAAHTDEDLDPGFGGWLDDYFKRYFGRKVQRYPGSGENGIEFHVQCAVFRTLLEGVTQGKSAHDKCLRITKCLQHGRDFLRGIIDGFLTGDGHLVDGRYTVGICPNRRLIEHLRTLSLLVGYEFRQNADTVSSAFGKKFPRANFWIRKNLDGPRRSPKNNGLVAEALDGIYPHSRKTRTIDIEVEIDHHLFFLANGVLTHNSNITRWKSAGDALHCPGDAWFVPYETTGSTVKKLHRHEFPLELGRRLVTLSGIPEGSLVFDPFVGGGTTCYAAAGRGMHSCGYDLSESVVNALQRAWALGITGDPNKE